MHRHTTTHRRTTLDISSLLDPPTRTQISIALSRLDRLTTTPSTTPRLITVAA